MESFYSCVLVFALFLWHGDPGLPGDEVAGEEGCGTVTREAGSGRAVVKCAPPITVSCIAAGSFYAALTAYR